MCTQQRAPIPQTGPGGDVFETPSSSIIAEYRIRGEPNQLLEDPDVEEDVVYRIIPGSKITRSLLEICGKQFLSKYGAWSGMAALEAKCIPPGAKNILVTAVANNRKQIGHCFVSQWIHMGQRIWWITQLLVVNGYRNQKRATRMLKVLTKHYDMGKLSSQTDYVGIISAHPYAICALLRVFSRGIEQLPSKPDWEKRWDEEKPLTPFPTPVCTFMMGTAPIKYLSTARMMPGTLTARTNFYLDPRIPKQAVERIVHSMNRQIVEPWEWLFGSLEQGCEYVCAVNYRYDPNYTLVPETCDALGSNGNPVDDDAVNFSSSYSSTYTDAMTSFGDPSPSIEYADIDRYLIDVPFRCILEPSLSLSHANLVGTKRKRIHEAKVLIAKQRSMLSVIMGGKPIPTCLQEAYQVKTRKYPLPVHMKSWAAFIEYMYECFPNDIDVTARVLILQAIHFQELLDKHERGEENGGKKETNEEIRRSLEPGENESPKPFSVAKIASPKDAESPSRLPISSSTNTPTKLPARYRSNSKGAKTPNQPPPPQPPTCADTPPKLPARYRQTPARTSRGLKTPRTRPQTAGRSPAKTSSTTPKARSTSMLLSMIPQRTSSQPRKTQHTPPSPTPSTRLQQTPPNNATPSPSPPPPLPPLPPPRNFSHPFPSTPPMPPSSTSHASTRPSSSSSLIPHYMAPTSGSIQRRYGMTSPSLFCSSDEADAESRCGLPGRRFPRNSAGVLSRGGWGREDGGEDGEREGERG